MVEITILLARWCIPGQELTDQDIDLHLASTPLVRPPTSVLNSITPRGWTICAKCWSLWQYANGAPGHDQQHRVKSQGGSLLLCVSQCLQQMSSDRKHLYTFIELAREVDALSRLGEMKNRKLANRGGEAVRVRAVTCTQQGRRDVSAGRTLRLPAVRRATWGLFTPLNADNDRGSGDGMWQFWPTTSSILPSPEVQAAATDNLYKCHS